ncbi:MAG: PEP-utilizing enzyme [Candidatus Aminicenantes bacterium]|jgi:phosphohistidine swiveling domain-containing protein
MGKKILQGIPVSGGVVTSKVRVINNVGQIRQIQHGDIMVVPNNNPAYAVGVMKAGGLICEEGGIISHICTVALEMGIPCITQAKHAVELMKTKDQVTLNADEGTVYGV